MRREQSLAGRDRTVKHTTPINRQRTGGDGQEGPAAPKVRLPRENRMTQRRRMKVKAVATENRPGEVRFPAV